MTRTTPANGRSIAARLFAGGFLIAAGGAMLAPLSPAANAAEAAATGFVLTSTTFKDGEMMPARVAYTKSAEFPNCIGENISPQLAWAKAPATTKSYAITMIDLEDVIHDIDLVVYGIPADVTSFAEGELSKPSSKFVGGRGARGQPTWRGMCPRPGTSPHHYGFMITATDLDPKELPPGLTEAELSARIQGHSKEVAVLVGLFARPK